MDTTTTNTKSGWLAKLLPLFSSAVEPLLGGVLHRYGQVAQTAVRSAVTRTDDGLNHLVAVYRKYDAAHPLVQTAIAEAQNLLRLTGLKAPSADELGSHIRAAIHDVASAFVTLDEPQKVSTSDQTTSPQV